MLVVFWDRKVDGDGDVQSAEWMREIPREPHRARRGERGFSTVRVRIVRRQRVRRKSWLSCGSIEVHL